MNFIHFILRSLHAFCKIWLVSVRKIYCPPRIKSLTASERNNTLHCTEYYHPQYRLYRMFLDFRRQEGVLYKSQRFPHLKQGPSRCKGRSDSLNIYKTLCFSGREIRSAPIFRKMYTITSF